MSSRPPSFRGATPCPSLPLHLMKPQNFLEEKGVVSFSVIRFSTCRQYDRLRRFWTWCFRCLNSRLNSSLPDFFQRLCMQSRLFINFLVSWSVHGRLRFDFAVLWGTCWRLLLEDLGVVLSRWLPQNYPH